MWDPQRKKDLFLIETKPLFALHKILSVLPKKKGQQEAISLTYKISSTVTKLQKMLSRIFGGLQFFVSW